MELLTPGRNLASISVFKKELTMNYVSCLCDPAASLSVAKKFLCLRICRGAKVNKKKTKVKQKADKTTTETMALKEDKFRSLGTFLNLTPIRKYHL